jgi:ribosomal protein S3AE
MAAVKKPIKKKFFTIEVPSLNKEVEAYATKVSELDGKTIKLHLSNELKGKALDLKLKVEADDKKAIAKPIETKILTSFLRKIMRKGVDYSEDSFITKCKDSEVKIKIIMVTRKRVTRAVLRALRNEARKEVTNYLAEKDFQTLILEIIDNKIQKEMSHKMKKVYPLSLFEVKYFGEYKSKEYQEKPEETEKEPEVKEEEQ